jgi:C-terminal processing protease CtpA/Prc
MFAYCIGIEDKATVSVELIETTSTKILWAYSVNKQRGGSKNQQSMAEAVAKHFKEFLSSSQPTVQAAIQAAADAPPPAPAAATVTPAQTAIPAAQRAETSLAKHESPMTEAAGQSTLGASFDGNLTIRHDGVTLSRVIAGGSADRAGVRSGDAILAIDDHYLFTAQEMMEEIQRHKPGSRVSIRYRHYSAINEASVVVGTAQ